MPPPSLAEHHLQLMLINHNSHDAPAQWKRRNNKRHIKKLGKKMRNNA